MRFWVHSKTEHKVLGGSIYSLPSIHARTLLQHHYSPEQYFCYNQWTYTDTSLLPKVHSSYQGSFLVLYILSLDKYIKTCIHQYSITQNSFTVPQILCSTSSIHLSLSSTLATTDFLIVSIVLLFLECYLIRLTEYVACIYCMIGFFHLVICIEGSSSMSFHGLKNLFS